MAKSEIRTIYVRYEPKNPGCQRANSHETDFAISIKSDEDPQNRDAVCTRCAPGPAMPPGLLPPYRIQSRDQLSARLAVQQTRNREAISPLKGA